MGHEAARSRAPTTSPPRRPSSCFPAIRPEAVGSAVFVPEVADLDAAGAVTAF